MAPALRKSSREPFAYAPSQGIPVLRAALLDFARRRHAVIAEDDHDGEFRFGGRHVRHMGTSNNPPFGAA